MNPSAAFCMVVMLVSAGIAFLSGLLMKIGNRWALWNMDHPHWANDHHWMERTGRLRSRWEEWQWTKNESYEEYVAEHLARAEELDAEWEKRNPHPFYVPEWITSAATFVMIFAIFVALWGLWAVTVASPNPECVNVVTLHCPIDTTIPAG